MIKSKMNELDEDFGIGVGAPLGADQGIPYSGDGKAVFPCYMGMTSRFGSVDKKASRFGDLLWPKRRKKRRKIRHRYPNFVQESIEDIELTPENIVSFLESKDIPDTVYHVEETDDNNIVVSLNANPTVSRYVDDVNNLFSVISVNDYDDTNEIVICIDRMTQTASIRLAGEEVRVGLACISMTDFENIWNELDNLMEA